MQKSRALPKSSARAWGHPRRAVPHVRLRHRSWMPSNDGVSTGRVCCVQGSDTFETTHRRKDGTVFPVEVAATHLDFQGGGLPLSLSCHDIFQRKQAEKGAERKRSFRYRTIVENINEALYVHDTEGTIQDINESACRMLGYAREELVGAHLSKIDSPRTQNKCGNV